MTQNLLTSFSEEWQELMRTLLFVPKPLQKARNWLERKYFAGFRTTILSSCSGQQPSNTAKGTSIERKLKGTIIIEKPPSWDELFEDLQEEIPLILDKSIVYRSRFLLLPSYVQRNLLSFLSENTKRIDSKLSHKFGKFLMEHIKLLDLWVQRIAWKYHGSHGEIDTLRRDKGLDFENPGAPTSDECNDSILGNSIFMSSTAIKYLDEIKETSRAYNAKGDFKLPYQSTRSETACFERKLDKDNAISAKELAERAEKSFEVISTRTEKEVNLSEEEDVQITEEVGPKRRKVELLDIIDVDDDDDDDPKEGNLQTVGSRMMLGSAEDEFATKCCEMVQDSPKPGPSKQHARSLSFQDILENSADVSSICLKLNEHLISNNENIDNLCNGLQLSELNEEQICIFINCMGYEKLNLSTSLIKKLLTEAVLKFLLNSDKAVSREIYSHLSDLLKTFKHVVIHSVLVPLIIHGKDNSFQEEFFLKILTSDLLENYDYFEVLNALLSVSRTDIATTLSNSSMKSLEIIFSKKVAVTQYTLSELVQVMERSSESLKDSKVLPKVIVLLTKHYKVEIMELVDRLMNIVENNSTFLKKIALRDLKKVKP